MWKWISCIAIILILMTALVFQTYGDVCHQTSDPHQIECIKDYVFLVGIILKFFDAHNGAVSALAGIAVAVFTLALKISTDRLWLAGERQIVVARSAATSAERAADAAEKTVAKMEIDTRILQRAYITVEPGGVESISEVPQIAKIIIRNSGNLPARDVRWIINSNPESERLRKVFPIGGKIEESTNILAPKGEMMRFQDTQHLPNEMRRVQNKELALYVWGQVYYLDGFGQNRWTKFCHRYEGDCLHGNGLEFAATRARQHQYGNGTDEDV